MTKISEIPSFTDLSLVIQTLQENGYFRDKDPAELKMDTEFQVFRIIGENKTISTESISEKFETSQSLSMILSNLQADNLIGQTSDYQWKPSDMIVELLTSAMKTQRITHQEKEEKQEEREEKSRLNSKKSLYKRIADQLVGSEYVPPNHTVEDLFQIPEIEILAIIYENQPIGTDEIDHKTILDSSVSLSLSNLQADNLIQQDQAYKWNLIPKLSAEIDHSIVQTTPKSSEIENQTDFSSTQNQAKIIEHKQLLKAILDIDYFPGKNIQEILETSEFEILNIINSYSPITAEEIEEKLTKETLLSLQLSNLSADQLIEQTNDIRWVLAENFRSRVSKVKVSQDEILEQIKAEEAKLEQSNFKSKMDTQSKNDVSIRPEAKMEDQDTSSDPKDPILAAVVDFGYVTDPQSSIHELETIPEYEILNVIAQRQPISADEINKLTNASSVSLTLSNLSADNLIIQNNDYQYELSDHFGDFQPTLPIEEEMEEISEEKEIVDTAGETVDQQVITTNQGLQDYGQLIVASFKAGYIDDKNKPMKELEAISEFEVLKIIGDNQPVDETRIKDLATSVSPVLISRTLSRLEAEDRIERVDGDKWKYTNAFETLMIEDELKEKQKQAEKQARKEEEERKRREALEKESRDKFVNLLRSEGIIEEDLTQEKLMQIPEFEILWIISQSETELSESQIKEKAESTSPVLITRTISQLEAKGRIQKTLAGRYELSSDLKEMV